MGARVEPGITTAKHLHVELASFQVDAIEIGDLEFTAGRWFEAAGDADHLLVIEIKAGYRVTAFWGFGLLFGRFGFSCSITFHDAMPFGISDRISKRRCSGLLRVGCHKPFSKVVSVKTVVPKR